MGSLRALLLLALVLTATAAERVVAPDGNDAAAGSATAPWGTLATAIGRLQAGDTLWVRGGTYRPAAWIDLPRSGSATAPIAIRAWPGETPVVDGQDAIPTWDWDGILNVRNRDHILIEGLTIIRSRWFGIGVASATAVTIRACRTDRTGASGIYVRVSQDIRVEDNEIRRACQFPLFSSTKGTQECITITGTTRFTVARNRVWDRLVDVSMGGEGIDVKGSSSDGVVEDNQVHDLVRVGIYIDAYGGTIARIAVRRNTVRACGQGIVVANEQDRGETAFVQVHDNLVEGSVRRGLSVAGWEGGGPIREIDIVNNTLVANGPGSGYEQTGLLIDTKNARSAGIRARNNVIAGSGRQIRTAGQAFVDIRRNLLWGAAPETGIAAIQADPGFVDGDAGDVRLGAGSPAIDTATGAALAATDRLGATRVQDGDGNGSAVADLGAHERGGTQVPMVGFALLRQDAVEPVEGATAALGRPRSLPAIQGGDPADVPALVRAMRFLGADGVVIDDEALASLDPAAIGPPPEPLRWLAAATEGLAERVRPDGFADAAPIPGPGSHPYDRHAGPLPWLRLESTPGAIIVGLRNGDGSTCLFGWSRDGALRSATAAVPGLGTVAVPVSRHGIATLVGR